MPYWQLFYHLVWATKNREPLLSAQVATLADTLMRQKARALGATVHALNGIEDHIHLVAAIPPKLSVARFVGQVKANTSTQINQQVYQDALRWQEDYGAFSFDRKRLPNYIAYVEQQREHHATNRLIPILERTGDSAVPDVTIRETSPYYQTGSDSWWQELLTLGNEAEP